MADCDEIICLDSDDSLDSAPVTNNSQLPPPKQNIVVNNSARHFSFASGLGQSVPREAVKNSRLQPTAQKIADNLARKFSFASGIKLSDLAPAEAVQNARVQTDNFMRKYSSASNNNQRHSTPAEVVKNTRMPIVAQNTTNNFVRNYSSSDKRHSAPGQAFQGTRVPNVSQNTPNNFMRNYSSSDKIQSAPGLTVQNTRVPNVAQSNTHHFVRNYSSSSNRHSAPVQGVQNIRVPNVTQNPRNDSSSDKRHSAPVQGVQNIRVPNVAQNTTNYSSSDKKHSAPGQDVQITRVPIVAQNTSSNFVRNYSSSDKRHSALGQSVQNTGVPIVAQNNTDIVRNYPSTSNKRHSASGETTQNTHVPVVAQNIAGNFVHNAMQNTSATNTRFEFPVAESTIAWSRNTSNFIKQSMNSAIKSSGKQMLLPTPPTAHQSSYPQLSNARTFMQNNGMSFMTSQSVSSNYNNIPYINVNPRHFEQGYYDQGILRNNFVPNINNVTNTNNDFWLKVRLEDLPNRGEVVSQYYFDHATQTPIQIRNNSPQLNSVLQTLDNNKECTNKKNITPNNNVEYQTINVSTPEALNNLKKSKNVVPPFLKRNRSVTTTPVTFPKTTEIDPLELPEKSEDNEVIFVKQLPNIVSSTINASSIESASTPAQETNPLREPELIAGDSMNKTTESNIVSFESNKPSSQPAKRQKKNVPEPRRNPKRQVQIEKDYMKMLVDSIWEPEKENKGRRLATARASRDKKVEKKPVKRSPRVQPTCGAIFSPPSPLTASHIRKWPTDGMHERPEYNCETGKIVKFDQLIRQIADEYEDKNKAEKKNTQTGIKEIGVDKDVPLSVLSHDVLHHVLSYVASTEKFKKDLKKSENSSATNNVLDDKIQFFEELKLVPAVDNSNEESCDTLNNNMSIVNKNTDDFSVKDVLKNNILLYCLTNNVDQADVAEYIEALKPQDIIHFSNRKFGIEPDVDGDLM